MDQHNYSGTSAATAACVTKINSLKQQILAGSPLVGLVGYSSGLETAHPGELLTTGR